MPTIFCLLALLKAGSFLRAEGAEALAAVPGGQAPAQGTDSASPPPRVEFGVELRWRNEFRDNIDFQPADDFDHFVGQRIRADLRVRAHPHLSLYIQGQDVELFDEENDKIIHELATNLHQAFFEWNPGGSEQWTLQGGRQEFIYGKQRLLGDFGWDNVGRSFDAVRLRHRRAGWSGDFFWARHVDVRRRGARSRPAPQDLYGAYLSRTRDGAPGRTEIYALFLYDLLFIPGEPGLNVKTTRIFTGGFRRVWQPAQGFRYEVENAWQFGQRGPDGHRAAALAASGGYGWTGKYKPSLVFEYDFATGDDGPDGRSREFHNLFPTNHLHYGYADLFGWRNIHDFRLTATAQVHAKLGFQADYHRLLLAERTGAWKNAGGRVLGIDPTGQAGRDVGQEIDLTFRVPVVFSFFKQLSLMGGYSVFFPGAFAERTRGPQTHHFGYVQTTLRF